MSSIAAALGEDRRQKIRSSLYSRGCHLILVDDMPLEKALRQLEKESAQALAAAKDNLATFWQKRP